jgi:transposase-like protein
MESPDKCPYCGSRNIVDSSITTLMERRRCVDCKKSWRWVVKRELGQTGFCKPR